MEAIKPNRSELIDSILFFGGTSKNTVSTLFLTETSTKLFVTRGVIVVTEYKLLSSEITLSKFLEK